MKIFTSLMLATLISLMLLPSAYSERRDLKNGYKLAPAAASMVEELTEVFAGFSELRKDGSGCVVVNTGYAGDEDHDKIFEWIVMDADKKGDWNGTADLAEVRNYFQAACQTRGK